MKNKESILIFLCILSLILIGCTGGGNTRNNPITQTDLRVGFEGIVLQFTKNAPPDRIFQETKFPIGIVIKNKGASDVTSVKKEGSDETPLGEGFFVLGFEKAYVDIDKDEKRENPRNFKIKGKSIFNINGDEEFIELKGKTKKVGSQSETHPSTIQATACYPYQTILGTSACIDTDVYGENLRKKSCNVKDLIFQSGQGAPVTITKIETIIPPHADINTIEPHFVIHIENKGNGEVVSKEKIKDVCSNTALNYKDFNKLNIRASLSNIELNCDVKGGKAGETEVWLREKKDIVRCTLKEGIQIKQDAYMAPLKIELDYGYTYTLSKNIIIERILEY